MKFILLNITICFLFTYSSAQVNIDSTQIKWLNGKPYYPHKVEKGQGTLAILRLYNLEMEQLELANPSINLKKLHRNDMVMIPIKSIVPKKNPTDSSVKKVDEAHANAEEVRKEISKNHIVQPGETLFKIAQKYKISVQDIIKWNAIKNNKIEVGKELIVNQTAVIKPFEPWNKPNSVLIMSNKPKHPIISGDLVEETGYLLVSEKDDVVLHSYLPAGSFILVTNQENGKELLLKITGNTTNKDGTNFILTLGENICQQLLVSKTLTRIKLKYTN